LRVFNFRILSNFQIRAHLNCSLVTLQATLKQPTIKSSQLEANVA
jgi:hypothetical protein